MYEPVNSKSNFPCMEEEVLALWDAEKVFEQSLKARDGAPEYVFYDGPPFATGLPHYGHLLAGTIKDIVPRYHTMRGHYVERRFGWDCHGLPIEALAQDALGLAGTAAIHERGVDVFNEQCRSMVQTYVKEWRETVTRMGRWVNFDNDYKTMDPSYMETIWWVFKQLWDQGRIYKSYRIMPYSWKLTTPLSNFEANSNYQDVQDQAVTVRARVREGAPDEDWYLLVWTTTPWTLPENLAICAGPEIDYVAVRDADEGCVYVMAKARLDAYYKKPEQYEVLSEMKGTDLKGWAYEPLFPYFADQPNAFCVLNDGYVTTEDGTGLVHMAPAYGEDDFRVCRSVGIELVDPLDDSCRFTAALPEYEGMFCKDAEKLLIRRLKDEGKLVHQSTITHSYPFCERTDTPLIYRAIDAWYVRVEDIRERLCELNDEIHWVPDYVGSKRFGNWLADANDWNISRNRFWGSCIPVWVNKDDPEDMICIGSVAELEELSGQTVTDLHKHRIDPIEFERDGKTYRRTPEVLDCWFESGSMPYAQQHYPFEREEDLKSFFPADFIAEGLDQTRGWFYTLLVLSTLLFDRAPFRNVVVNGMVQAEDGRKMSKRLKNYPDPFYMVNTYGADALRLYMLNSSAVRAEDLRFSEDGVKELVRHILIPWWNAYSFFVTYANIDEWQPDDEPAASSNVLDGWIRSSLETLTDRVTIAMDNYDLQRSVRPFVHFIEDLTNWYIRRSRRRFWKSQDDVDKQQAYCTLHYVLLQLSRIAAPFVPFISEAIYRNLRTSEMPVSVHLCSYPKADGVNRNPELEAAMSDVMTIVRLGRQLRTEHNLKVRQPLSVMHVATRDDEARKRIGELEDLITDELNVKQVALDRNEAALVTLSGKANFRSLGKRLGREVQAAAKAIATLDQDSLETLTEGGSIELTIGGQQVAVAGDDVVVERLPREGVIVAAEGALVVALETSLTPELVAEGLAREFVNKVQNMRKTAGFEVTQRIEVSFTADDEVVAAVSAHDDYVTSEILALSCAATSALPEGAVEWDLNGHACSICVSAPGA